MNHNEAKDIAHHQGDGEQQTFSPVGRNADGDWVDPRGIVDPEFKPSPLPQRVAKTETRPSINLYVRVKNYPSKAQFEVEVSTSENWHLVATVPYRDTAPGGIYRERPYDDAQIRAETIALAIKNMAIAYATGRGVKG